MNPQELKDFMSTDEDFLPHKEYLDAISRPSVDIVLSDAEIDNEGSRFGGVPLVGKDFVWPKHEIGEYRFLGQINFSEIRNCPEPLPKSGLLSLFYAYDDDGEIFWGDDGYVIAYYYPDVHELVLFESGAAPSVAKTISLEAGVEIPRRCVLRSDWPFDTDLLYALPDLKSYSENYLLGYPSFSTLAYDPTPGDGWIPLLTLASEDQLDWCWHDGDKLMVFIEKEKLLNLEFNALKADAG